MSMENRARALNEAVKIAETGFITASIIEEAEKIEAYLAGKKECAMCGVLMNRVNELESALRAAAAGVHRDKRVEDTLRTVLAAAEEYPSRDRANVESAVDRASELLEVDL